MFLTGYFHCTYIGGSTGRQGLNSFPFELTCNFPKMFTSLSPLSSLYPHPYLVKFLGLRCACTWTANTDHLLSKTLNVMFQASARGYPLYWTQYYSVLVFPFKRQVLLYLFRTLTQFWLIIIVRFFFIFEYRGVGKFWILGRRKSKQTFFGGRDS